MGGNLRGGIIGQPGELVGAWQTTNQSTTNAGQFTAFTCTFNFSGTARFRFGILNQTGSSYTGYAQIYKNGVAHGTLRSTSSPSYTYYDEDLAFASGDVITFRIWKAVSDSFPIVITDMKVKFVKPPIQVA